MNGVQFLDISHPSSAEVKHAWSFTSIPYIYLYDVEHSHEDTFIFAKTFPPDNTLYYTVLTVFNVFSIPALRKMGVSITEGSISELHKPCTAHSVR
jgi:hypothetical protein